LAKNMACFIKSSAFLNFLFTTQACGKKKKKNSLQLELNASTTNGSQ